MADFGSWTKHNLVNFAQDAQKRLDNQKAIIAELEQQLRAVHLAWRLELARSVPDATLRESHPQGASQ